MAKQKEGAEGKGPQAKAEAPTADSPKTRIVRFRPTSIPITTSLQTNIPDANGKSIPYSQYRIGFTQLVLEMPEEELLEVEVDATGDSLEEFKAALKLVGLALFEANQELAREAWLAQRESARDEALENII